MKFGLWTAYGALNSKPVFEAFSIGLQKLGHTFVENQTADVDVIWSVLWNGRMHKNKAIWDTAMDSQKTIIVLEVGGLKRGYTWRLGLNGVNNAGYFGEKGNDSTRRKKLGIELTEWKNNDGPILIASQHNKSGQWKNDRQMYNWLSDTISQIQTLTDKQIILRPHPRCNIANNFENKNIVIQRPKKIIQSYDDYDLTFSNIHCVINWSSNPGIQAAISGIPVFVGPYSLAYEVSNKNLDTILNPFKPDRTQWINDLVYTEWTTSEIASGYPLSRLLCHI